MKRKRNADETQTTPNKNEKNEKNNNIKERANNFGESLEQFITNENRDEIHKFWYYWTEPNKSNTRLRFEMEKTWDTKKRLSTWYKNSGKFKK